MIESINNKKYFKLFLTLVGIFIGTAIYALGLVAINMQNDLAEGGLTGITLILRYWFKLDPAYSTILLNIPLIIIGLRFLGARALFLTLWGTLSLSFSIFIWQRIPIISQFNIEHDLFIAALLAGMIGGLGLGIVFKIGGTTGGTDIVARIMEMKLGWPIGKSMLMLDFLVLTASLSYLDVKHMMYTLIASYVFSIVVNFVQDGGYSAKGVYIISDKVEDIGKMIDIKLNRGFTYLRAEGGYSNNEKRVLYVVLSSNEVPFLKEIIKSEDENAFYSVMNVHEVFGEGFTYDKKKINPFKPKKSQE